MLTAAAVLGAAPRRQQGEPDRRRQRPGPAGRGQPGPRRGAVPRRVPAVPRRRDRGAAPAAGERRRHDRAARGVGHAARPAAMVVLACNPCPCGDYSADVRRQPVHLPGGRSAATTAARSPARSPTGSTSSGTWRRCARTTRRDRLRRRPSRRRRSGRGSRRPGPRQAERLRRARAGGSTATRPGPVAARALAAHRGRPAAPSTTRSTTAGSPAAARTRVHRLAWTVADLPRSGAGPGVDEVDVALRLRTGDPLLALACWSGSDERRRSRHRGRPAGPGRALRDRRARRPAARRPGRPSWAPRRCTTTCSPSATSPGCQTDPAARLAAADPERELADGDRLGLRFVVPGDAEWPAQLDDLARRGAGPGARRRAARALGARAAAARRARRLASRSSARARRRRTAPTSPPRSPPTVARRPAGAWSPARRSASTRPPTAVRSRSTGRPSPCSPAAPTGPTRRRTPQLIDHIAADGRGRLRGGARAGRRRGSGSWPATG